MSSGKAWQQAPQCFCSSCRLLSASVPVPGTHHGPDGLALALLGPPLRFCFLVGHSSNNDDVSAGGSSWYAFYSTLRICHSLALRFEGIMES